MVRSCNFKGFLLIAVLIMILCAPTFLIAQSPPPEAEVHNRLGNDYCERGEFNKGVKEYEEAIKIYPGYVDAYYNLGVTYYHDLKDYQKAADDFKKFLELEPTSPDAQQVKTWLAEIEKKHGIKPETAPEKGVEVAKIEEPKKIEAKETKPEEVKKPLPPTAPVKPLPPALPPPPIMAKPKAEEKPEVKETKEDKFAQALAHKDRGNQLSQDGKYQMAVQEYLKSLELRPAYNDALYNLSKTYDFDLNDDENAIKYYEEFLKNEPPNSKDAKEVSTWLLKAKTDLAKAKDAQAEKKVAKVEKPIPIPAPVPIPVPIEKPPVPKPAVPPPAQKPVTTTPCARYDDLPFIKDLMEVPTQVASVAPKESIPPEKPIAVTPPPSPVPLPAPIPVPVPVPVPVAPSANAIVLTSYTPRQEKSVQTSLFIREQMKDELMDVFKSKNAQDADKLTQLFMTKVNMDTLPKGDEVLNVEVSGDLLANIRNVYVLSHRDRIELNNEKGNLFRFPQTDQTRARLQEITRILEDGYEIKR